MSSSGPILSRRGFLNVIAASVVAVTAAGATGCGDGETSRKTPNPAPTPTSSGRAPTPTPTPTRTAEPTPTPTCTFPEVHFDMDPDVDIEARQKMGVLIDLFKGVAQDVDGLPWVMLAAIAGAETRYGALAEAAEADGLTPLMGLSQDFLNSRGLSIPLNPLEEMKAVAQLIEEELEPKDRSNPYAVTWALRTLPKLYPRRLLSAYTEITGKSLQVEDSQCGQRTPDPRPTSDPALLV